MSPGRRQLFLYWRVAPAQVDAALQALHAWQRQLREQHPALQATVYLRREAAAAEATVMESYALQDAAGIGDALQRHIEQAGDALLRPWLQGHRHVEVFDRHDAR